MLCQGVQWGVGILVCCIPDVQQIIIATTCQMLSVRRPPQPAYLLRMPSQCTNFMLNNSHVMMVNSSASTATSNTNKSSKFQDTRRGLLSVAEIVGGLEAKLSKSFSICKSNEKEHHILTLRSGKIREKNFRFSRSVDLQQSVK